MQGIIDSCGRVFFALVVALGTIAAARAKGW